MAQAWSSLKIPDADFDVAALHAAIDAKRLARGLTWKSVALEVNRAAENPNAIHPISASTIAGLKTKTWGVEGDGVLQMIIWLDRTPESFGPGHPGADHPDARLARVDPPLLLRFDTQKIHALLDARRAERGLRWADVAGEVGGHIFSAQSLQRLHQNSRARFPSVMRLARWLHVPCAMLTHVAAF